MTMSAEQLRDYCLDFPAAVEDYPFDSSPELCTFKVEGKIFAICRLTAPPPLELSLKCDPQIALTLRASHPSIIAGYHLNKKHWNTVALDSTVPDRLVREMIQDSFDLVVEKLPKHQRIRLR